MTCNVCANSIPGSRQAVSSTDLSLKLRVQTGLPRGLPQDEKFSNTVSGKHSSLPSLHLLHYHHIVLQCPAFI